MVMFIFNVFYVIMQPDALFTVTIGAVTGFVASILAVGVISGLNILGSGLNSASIKILFGTASLLTMMFSIPIAGFPLGMGLATNIIAVFGASGDTFGQLIGFMLGTGLAVMTIVSGLMVMMGSGE